MTGAIDNVQIIVDLFKKHNIKEYHIHYDGALFGGMIPFMENGPELNFETLPSILSQSVVINCRLSHAGRYFPHT